MSGTIIGLAICCILGLVALNYDPRDSSSSTTFAPASAFAIETSAFRFTMPTTPTEEAMTNDDFGFTIVSSAWTVHTDDLVLQVVAMDFGIPLDEDMAQASFDGSMGGIARRANATIVSDEPFTQGDMWGRRTVFELDGARLFVESYAKGTWIVSIEGGETATASRTWRDATATRPAAFETLVASFSFA